MGDRRDRLNKRQARQTATRRVNSVKKDLEGARRDTSMLGILQKGTLPYAPAVMSWLSMKLDKKAARITDADVKELLN